MKRIHLLHIAALVIAAILLLTSFGKAQNQPVYKSEPFVRELGLQIGKLPLTANGLQRAVQSLGDSGVVLISFPGVWDTAGVGAIPEAIKIKGWLFGEEVGIVNFEIDDSTGIAAFVSAALVGYATEEYVTNALENFEPGLDEEAVQNIVEDYDFPDKQYVKESVDSLKEEIDLKVFEDFTQYDSDTPTNDDVFLFMDINSQVVKRVPFSQIMAGEVDLSGYSTNIYTYQSIDSVRNELSSGLSGKANSDHNHSGVYEPANANIQSHISSTSNPHAVTKTQVGLGNVPNTDATNPANITQSSSYRFTTDSEKSTWNNKQDALISGTNIKSINSESILGSGNITISGSGGSWGSITGTITDQSDLESALNSKQNTLVSGTNIKTVNSESILGAGNIDVGGGSTRGWRWPADFGAAGNGVTDDAMAIMKTTVALNSGEDPIDSIFVQFEPGKTYYYGGEGGLFWSTSGQIGQTVRYLHIEGNGATIDVDTNALAGSGYFLGFLSYYNDLTGGWTPIPNSYNRGDIEILVDEDIAEDISMGDVLWITTHPDLGGTHQDPDWLINSVAVGELAEVAKVSGNLVTLLNPLAENYNSSYTVIKRFYFPKVVIRNLKITSRAIHCTGSNKRAIDFTGIKDFLFENVEVQGFDYLGISINNSINGIFENVRTRDLSTCANYGMNYGLVVAGVQNIKIDKCDLQGGRHGIDIASSYYLPTRDVTVSLSTVSADLELGTSSLASHPGARDVTLLGNTVYGIIGMRSTHNSIIGNRLYGWFNDGQGTGQVGIAIHNAWNPTGGWNKIIGNYFEGQMGGIELLTGNEGGCVGNYHIIGNSGVSQYFLKIESYYDSDGEMQYIDDLVIEGNDWKGNGLVDVWATAVIVGYGNQDSLTIRNFQFHDNTLRGKQYALKIYSPSSRTFIEKLSVKNNTFSTRGAIEVQSGSNISYLEYVGNTLRSTATSGGGWERPVWLRSGATVSTFKHLENTYMNFGSMDGEAFVQVASGVVTNWYRGLDVVLGTTSFSLYDVTATNGFSVGWTSD